MRQRCYAEDAILSILDFLASTFFGGAYWRRRGTTPNSELPTLRSWRRWCSSLAHVPFVLHGHVTHCYWHTRALRVPVLL